MFGDLLDLVHSLARAGLGLVAEVEPRLDAGQQGAKAVALKALQVRFRQERQTALGDVLNPAGRDDFLDGAHVIFEANAEIRIVPDYVRRAKLRQEKPQVLLEHAELELLIGNRGV